MRTSDIGVALALSALLVSGSASAAMLSPPAVPANPMLVTVDAMQMMVSSSYAHLREKPTTHSKMLATLDHGTKVDVIEKVDAGKWVHVKAKGMDGYIAANLLK
jgi:uncharacterized protein YgiM (DUF1202 family)